MCYERRRAEACVDESTANDGTKEGLASLYCLWMIFQRSWVKPCRWRDFQHLNPRVSRLTARTRERRRGKGAAATGSEVATGKSSTLHSGRDTGLTSPACRSGFSGAACAAPPGSFPRAHTRKPRSWRARVSVARGRQHGASGASSGEHALPAGSLVSAVYCTLAVSCPLHAPAVHVFSSPQSCYLLAPAPSHMSHATLIECLHICAQWCRAVLADQLRF
jgi:hypothetical protein